MRGMIPGSSLGTRMTSEFYDRPRVRIMNVS